MSFKKKIIRLCIAILCLYTGIFSVDVKAKKEVNEAQSPKVKNIILIIPDGAGLSYYTAYRYFHTDKTGADLTATIFDPYYKGLVTTYSHSTDENITDSAAAATAIATGEKTYNGAISVDKNNNKLPTVLEYAKEKGISTGIVVTAEINHATPAAFVTHNESRKNLQALADSYFDETINGSHKVDVMLGGGLKYFKRKDRDLVKEFQKDGYTFVQSKEELSKNTNKQLLGLFDDQALQPAIDRTKNIPSLVDMTEAAIKQLSKNKNGFFLLVEASQIDFAGHDNDIVYAMSEMNEYAKVFSYAIDFAKKDGNTQVFAMADHNTGGFTVGSTGVYKWDSQIISAAKRTPNFIAEEIANGAPVESILKKYLPYPLTTQEINVINTIVNEAGRESSSVYTAVDTAIEDLINKHSYSGWTTTGHTGDEVPLFAYGVLSKQCKNVSNNTDIAKIIFNNYK